MAKAYAPYVKTLHWITGLLILALLVEGEIMTEPPEGWDRGLLFLLHKSTGIVVMFYAAAWVLWRAFSNQPKAKGPFRLRWPTILKISYYVLYTLMLVMPLSGWALSTASGHPASLYGLAPFPLFPFIAGLDEATKKELAGTLAEIHETGAQIFAPLLVFHIGVALNYHFRLHTNFLRRMLPSFIGGIKA